MDLKINVCRWLVNQSRTLKQFWYVEGGLTCALKGVYNGPPEPGKISAQNQFLRVFTPLGKEV